MTTITEDYVSFETAKLLKEKGFDVKCNECYAYFADDDIRVLELKYQKSAQLLSENRYPCISLQMVMKWLREVHNIFISIHRSISGNGYVYYHEIYNGGIAKYAQYGRTYPTYEEACEAAIKYCLEILI